MRRRKFLQTAAVVSVGSALTGCTSTSDDAQTTDSPNEGSKTAANHTEAFSTEPSELSGTLTVATYSSFIEAPSSSPGPWIKTAFEEQFPGVTVEFDTPDSELNHYLLRKRNNQSIDADVYVGLNVDELLLVDDKLDDQLFTPISGDLPNSTHIVEELRIDPKGRAIPYDTGYISLVYNDRAIDAPETFEDLTRPEYQGTLLAQNAQTSDTGKAFLLWTIHTKGSDSYLDYWQQLLANDAQILGSWDKAYSAYTNGQRPIVVSYSTDQVYANRNDQPMYKHQIGFLNNQAYANPEAMAIFDDTDNPAVARAFLNFLLSRRAQAEIAVRNVAFPATEYSDLLPSSFGTYARIPDKPVTHTYQELRGKSEQWVNDWARMIASN